MRGSPRALPFSSLHSFVSLSLAFVLCFLHDDDDDFFLFNPFNVQITADRLSFQSLAQKEVKLKKNRFELGENFCSFDKTFL